MRVITVKNNINPFCKEFIMQQKNITLLTILFLSKCISITAMDDKKYNIMKNTYRKGDTYTNVINNVKTAQKEFEIIAKDYLGQPLSIQRTIKSIPRNTNITTVNRKKNVFLINIIRNFFKEALSRVKCTIARKFI